MTKRISERVVLLFSFFFLVIMAFWCLKPLRTAGVVKAMGPDLYPLIKQGSLLLVPLVMLFYDACVARFSRGGFVRLFTVLFVAGCSLFWASYRFFPGNVAKVGFFYFVDIYATVMVTLFWTYLNSLFSADEAKKAYGIIGSGGLLGGIVGSSISGWANKLLGAEIILLAGIILGLVLLVVNRLETLNPSSEPIAPPRKNEESAWKHSTEGIRMVLRSPYLLSMVGMVGLYELVSSIADYQFNASCTAAIASEIEMAGFQGRVFFWGQVASLVVMLFVTPVVFKRFGILVGLLLLPTAMGTGALAFAMVPVLGIMTATVGTEMAFAYSINQASKEILYLPLTTLEKFKAKAVIDMFVYRFGKALGAGIVLAYLFWLRPFGMTSSHLMIISAFMVSLWVFSVRKVAKRFDQSTATTPKAQAA